MEISFEAHSRWNLPMSIRIAKELEKYNVTWLEDPMLVDDVKNYAALRRKVNIPILASERLITRFQYRPLLEQEATDLIMVDIGWTGGFSECKKIAAMAEAYRVPITTHNCGGPVMTLASAHLCISCPNSYGTESVRAFYKTFYQELVEEKLDIRNGHLFLSDTPGLGVKLRPDLLKRKDIIRVKSEGAKHLIFAAAGDPWAQSPGDNKARKIMPE
jgi:L-alanine-DL-glutamate epimerase-like enolase superfamily enzyme